MDALALCSAHTSSLDRLIRHSPPDGWTVSNSNHNKKKKEDLDAARAARDAAREDHERVGEEDVLARRVERVVERGRDVHDELLRAVAEVRDRVEPL